MGNILIRIHTPQDALYYSFTQSVTGTLDYNGKENAPDISDYQEIESSHYFSPSWYAFLPKEFQGEIHILFQNSVDLQNADLCAFLTHVGALLLAVENKDNLLVAELLERRTEIFFKFLPLTLYIIKPVAPLALFAWLYGRFSDAEGFLKMYKENLKFPTKADAAEILFAAAFDELDPHPEKENDTEMFVRYSQKQEQGSFTIGTVGSQHHSWNSDITELDYFLKDAFVRDFENDLSRIREKKAKFISELQVSMQAEPYNPHDPNAIGVSIEDVMEKLRGNSGKSKAGYIRASGAAILRKAFPRKLAYKASLMRLGTNLYKGGFDKEGVVLRVRF
ncbi:hypothetical protein [Fibrobacter intestinalis]|uniref:Uncharacterized protein n=1 Tax=Fibrobacter intestinalis TaxID=28122 RepID=A0A1T4K8Z1_9BACT|nr:MULTISPECIES: hypothetical protein [Fibrobacter]PBC74942.1 hypothetical protein BGW94_2619 [Fibrobacter sp. NR9]SJZ38881.1 hypothetical protein SAMN02745108_00361 [Fibrobacter intestinalis]